MENIVKIVKSLEDSGILLERVSETIKNETKEQKGGFLGMLLGALGTSLLGNMLAGKGFIRAGEGTAQVGHGSKRSSLKKKLILPHQQTLKYNCTIKMNLDLIGFILEIICLIK